MPVRLSYDNPIGSSI